MNDIKLIIKNENFYIKKFLDKGVDASKDIGKISLLHNKYLSLLQKEEMLRSQLNEKNNKIKKTPSSIGEIQHELSELSKKIKKISPQVTLIKKEINHISSYFPNIAGDISPTGKDENDNVEISKHNCENKENPYAKPHWEILKEKKLILESESSLISGTRHVIFSDKTALLVRAIQNFMIDNAVSNGFTLIDPPVIVNKEMLFNTAQLPKFEEDLFKLTNGQYLVPTAEVPLVNLFAKKILDKSFLPVKFVSFTSCFRSEAGSAGRDTRGIIRLHQFRKIEIVKAGLPESEEEDFNTLLRQSTELLDLLDLPYRKLELCTGNMPFASKRTVDIEVWMSGTKEYKEISSVSSAGDFQARRMNAKYKDEDGKNKLIYTYNASALAIERTVAAILENYIDENNKIKIPKVLKKYLPFNFI